jgi:hypothetical protein
MFKVVVGEGTNLVRTGDDLGELALLLILALDDGFDDGGMVRSEIDEDVADAIFPEGLEEGERCCVSVYISAIAYINFDPMLTP